MNRMRRRRKGLKASFREFWAERRRNKRIRKQQRSEYAYVRKKIRRARIRNAKSAVLRFFRNPFGKKRLNRGERVLRKHLKADIREHRIYLIRNLPSMLFHRFRQYKKQKKEQFDIVRTNFNYSLNPLTGQGSKDLRSDLLTMGINSTLLYIITFWAMYLTGQMVTVLTARFFSIPAVLYSYITDWPLFIYSPLYTRKNLILIFGLGPFACLVLAFLMYRLFLVTSRKGLKLKLFLVWMVFHGLNMFFGAYIAGVITRTGLIYSSAWIFLSRPYDIEEIIFMILSVIILLIFGYVLTSHFIRASLSERIIQPRIRLFYVFFILFVPLAVGNLFIYLTNFPEFPLNIMLLQGFSLLMVIPAFIFHNTPSNLQLKPYYSKRKVQVRWVYVLVIAVLTVVIRVFIHPGIQFG